MKNYEELINEIVKLNEERNIKLSVLPHCSNLLFQLQKSEPKKLSYFEGVVENYLKSLSFTPNSFDTVFESPNAYIHTKDQDFVLGVNVEIEVTADGNSQNAMTVIPVVAIECKTYLERNMLDSCAATAGRLKTAMPYCIYIVASEYMKMSDACLRRSRVQPLTS